MAWSKERAAVPAAKTPVSRAPTPKALQAAVGLTRDEVIKRFGKPRVTLSHNGKRRGEENFKRKSPGHFDRGWAWPM